MNKTLLAAWAGAFVLFSAVSSSAAAPAEESLATCSVIYDSYVHGKSEMSSGCRKILDDAEKAKVPEAATNDNKLRFASLRHACFMRDPDGPVSDNKCVDFYKLAASLEGSNEQAQAAPGVKPSGPEKTTPSAGKAPITTEARPDEMAAVKRDDEQAAAAAKKASLVANGKLFGSETSHFDYLSPKTQIDCGSGANCRFTPPAAAAKVEKSIPPDSKLPRATRADEEQDRQEQRRKHPAAPHVLSAKENRKLAETCARWTGEGKCLCQKGAACATKRAAKNPAVDGPLPRKAANKTPDSPFGFFASLFAGFKNLFSPAPTAGRCRLRGTNSYCARGEPSCVCR